MGSIANAKGAEPFTLKDAPVENHRPMKVVIIGAGYSGIYTAIR
jgi:pyruvate/2-oxoglutarate dehydrogenase complex dihydrolipoamide dehydrogenase (E3) component